jgi:hypothetical protein
MLKSTLRFNPDRDPGRQDGTRSGGTGAVEQDIGTYLDTLELRGATIGDDIVLEESPQKEFVLHEVIDCRARKVGAFRGAIDAWIAIDELDDARAGRHPATD